MRSLTQLVGIGATLLLVACGGGSSSTAPPTVSLSAAKKAVNSGEATTLTWSSTNATSCAASGGWTGTLASSGNKSTGPLTAATTFSLTCTGGGGMSQAASVMVNIAPTAKLTASPTLIGQNASSTLTWSSTNATSCTASGGWSGSLAPSGSKSTGALSKTTSFSLTCAGAGGTSSAASATVTVTTVPTAVLSASPTVVAPNGTSTLTWSSLNSTSCTASGAWSGTLLTSGTKNTGPLTSPTNTFTLTCSGTSGTSTPVSATVAVSSTAMSVAPTNAAITLTRTQQFTATVPGGGPATWTVDGVTGGNASVGQVSSTGLYTAGTAAGGHTIVATSVANATQKATATVAVTDLAGVYTYHNNLSRDGTNIQEYALTTANINTQSFGKRASCPVDGAIYAQPLWVANVTVQGAKHNVVYVATQHDGLFAFDADASPCKSLWSANLIDTTHGGASGETSVPSTLVGSGFGDIQPEIGVTGTPVIDPASGTLYVVSKSVNSGTFFQRLHAIDLATGNEKTGSPTLISASFPGTGSGGSSVAFDPHLQHQRPGLALVNGVVYIAWASHEDQGPWYGWMIGYTYNGTAFSQAYVLNVSPNTGEAGIWMSGGAPAADASNNLYVITGNGGFDATSSSAPNNDYGDSLLQLVPTATPTPHLRVSQYFAPSDQLADSQNDKDFGAGGAALLADLPAGNTVTHALIAGGKDHDLYILNRDMLGGLGDQGAVQEIDMGSAIFATAAFWNNSFYISTIGTALRAYKLNPTTVQFTLGSSSAHSYGFPGSTPSVSASSASQNGIVWSIDSNHYCTLNSPACGPAVLYAHDASNLASELWDSSQVAGDAAGNGVKFTVPTIANGAVFIGTRGNNTGGADSSSSTPGELDIYALKP